MAEKPATEKTEPPTPRKLQKARSQGQVPQSQELTSVATIISLVAVITLMAPKFMSWATNELKIGLSCNGSVLADSTTFVSFINSRIINAALFVSPVFAAIMVAGIIAEVYVAGPNFTAKALKFNLNAINPISGLERLVNLKSFVHLLISIIKLAFMGLIIWFYIRNKIEDIFLLRWAWSAQIMAGIGKLILGLMIRVCVGLLIIAFADVIFQKWKYMQDLKMTRQEVKQDHKDTDGSPEVKARIRKMQYQVALKRFLQEVPKASVVLVNPTHYAVALRYDPNAMECPVLLAKGVDHLAEKIREIATAYGVPIIRRPELTRTIYATIEPGQPITPELFVAVAEVLALIYRIKQRKYQTVTK